MNKMVYVKKNASVQVKSTRKEKLEAWANTPSRLVQSIIITIKAITHVDHLVDRESNFPDV